ncbi:MAG: FAD-binding protein [Actinomycetia bacterium]|nr:FAD-binding protein [Actinomycetes bacterium]
MTTDFANWSGLVASRPAEVRAVSSVAEVQVAVADAAAHGWAVRTVGTTHSHSDVLHADDGLVLLTDGLGGPPVVEPGLSRARIPGGTKLHAIGGPLWDAGFSLANQGDVDVQSVAGLVGTGVHGTGRSLRSISDSVVGATIVTASGDLVSSDDDPDLLEAARLNLGALGVVVDLTLRLLPAYHLHERSWSEALTPIMERLDVLTLATRHFEFFWYPVTDKAYAKALNPCEGPVDPMGDHKGEYVDRSYAVFPSERADKHTEMEYSVPAEEGPECFLRIRELMQTRFPAVTWPAEYRTVAADEGWISPARGRPTVAISVHQGVGEPYEEFFAACESIFRDHQGRPHWGKVHNLTAANFAAEHPDTWERFWGVQARLDPDGRFLNGHLRRVAGR